MRGSGFLTKVESLRGLAALSVAVGHSIGFILLGDYSVPIFELAAPREVAYRLLAGLSNGQMAVTVFFVISGLVIGRSLDRQSGGRRARAYGGFLFTRGFRLYPAHIVALCGVTLLAWQFLMHAEPLDLSAYEPLDGSAEARWLNGEVYNPLKLTSVIGNLALASWSMNLVIWSLYVELCVAPLLPLFHWLSRKDWPLLDAAMLAGLLALSLLLWNQLWLRYWFVFYAGMVIDTRGHQWARLVLARATPAAVAILSCAVMMLPGMLIEDRPPVVVVFEMIGAFSLVGLIVCSGHAKPFRFLDHPVLRWNGRVSYSFYLWHYMILTVTVHELYEALDPLDMRQHEIALFLAVTLATCALALAVAHLSYHWVELPFIAAGRRLIAALSGAGARPAGRPSP